MVRLLFLAALLWPLCALAQDEPRTAPASGQPAAPAPELQLYVAVDGQQLGPLGRADFADLVAAGQADAHTRVWIAGMADWAPASAVPELAALLPAAAQEPPPLRYHVAQNGEPTGPFEAAALRELAVAGTLTASTPVWTQGMANWAPAATRPDLEPILAAAAAEFDVSAFLAGLWVQSFSGLLPGRGEHARLQITVEYLPGGGFTMDGIGAVDTPLGPAPIKMHLDDGRWRARDATPQRILVEFSGTIETTESPPPMALSEDKRVEPQTRREQTSWSVTFEVVDRDTLRGDGGGIFQRQRGGGRDPATDTRKPSGS